MTPPSKVSATALIYNCPDLTADPSCGNLPRSGFWPPACLPARMPNGHSSYAPKHQSLSAPSISQHAPTAPHTAYEGTPRASSAHRSGPQTPGTAADPCTGACQSVPAGKSAVRPAGQRDERCRNQMAIDDSAVSRDGAWLLSKLNSRWPFNRSCSVRSCPAKR
jgi:hypothetical protein